MKLCMSLRTGGSEEDKREVARRLLLAAEPPSAKVWTIRPPQNR